MQNFDWESEFRTLMEYQRLDSKTIKLRFQQIDINKKLKGVAKVSNILISLKDKFGLTGEFESLDNIVESVS
jgi:uncharacterized protein YeeX (DUF496 family)